MNNNYCNKCGKFIEAGTKFCNNCGNFILQEEQKNVPELPSKLTIRRKKSIIGCAVGLNVNINGTKYIFKSGTEMNFNLFPGNYNISWKFWCRRLQKVDIIVTPGKYYIVEIVPDLLWGGFKLGKKSKLN